MHTPNILKYKKKKMMGVGFANGLNAGAQEPYLWINIFFLFF